MTSNAKILTTLLIVVVLIIIIISLLVVGFLAFFFRKPSNVVYRPHETNVIRGPAFGRVMKIQHLPDEDKLFIAIFLSPLDIHYQQAPISARVKSVQYDATGQFSLAFNENKSKDNEKSIITFDTAYGDLIMYQIAGLIVRRIDTYVQKGDQEISGSIIGLIKFGSRVDLIIPRASQFQLKVKEGDYVSGSETIIGEYAS